MACVLWVSTKKTKSVFLWLLFLWPFLSGVEYISLSMFTGSSSSWPVMTLGIRKLSHLYAAQQGCISFPYGARFLVTPLCTAREWEYPVEMYLHPSRGNMGWYLSTSLFYQWFNFLAAIAWMPCYPTSLGLLWLPLFFNLYYIYNYYSSDIYGLSAFIMVCVQPNYFL